MAQAQGLRRAVFAARPTRLFVADVGWITDRVNGLLRTRSSAGPAALEQIREWHPRFSDWSDEEIRQAPFKTALSREHQGPRAVLNAVDRLASNYGTECIRVQQALAIAEAQLRDYQARLGKPFTLDAYLSELTALRDQLKAGLSSMAHGSGKEEGPSVSELAEKIKTIKADHSVDATPQRVRQKQSTAEEPVTARIRRRTEATGASGPPIEPIADTWQDGASRHRPRPPPVHPPSRR